MTDGCGFINRSALKAITQRLGYPTVPTAIQGRIAGAKGLWILHPTDDESNPTIWIRDSQDKIKYCHLDRAHRILDLVHVSHPAPSSSICHLSMQSVMNLSFNGVPNEVLVSLMKEGLEESVKPLMEWSTPNAMLALWDAINRAGRVSGTRLSRVAAGRSRALGFSGREWGNSYASGAESNELWEDSDLEDAAQAISSGRNEYSGGTSPFDRLLSSGRANWLAFSTGVFARGCPGTCPGWISSCETAYSLVKGAVYCGPDNKVSHREVSHPSSGRESCGGFCYPRYVSWCFWYTVRVCLLFCADPLGILKPDEIYYRSSNSILDSETQTMYNTLTGEVLVGHLSRYVLLIILMESIDRQVMPAPSFY